MLTELQHAARSLGIGASESPIIMGASKYCTPYKLWLKKTGKLEDEPLEESPALWWGSELESSIAKRYEILTGFRTRRVNATLFHHAHPHILCHLDRKVVKQRKIIEIKTVNSFAYNDSSEWGEEGSDYIPEAYIWQVQHQLAITGYKLADLVVYPKGAPDIKTYPIVRDEELISMLIQRVNDFWITNVLCDNPPPLSNRDDVNYVYPRNNGNFKIVSDIIHQRIEEYKIYKSIMKQEEKECVLIQTKIMEYIGEYDGVKNAEGKVLATWKANKNGIRTLRIA